jgi:hypothetical protein
VPVASSDLKLKLAHTFSEECAVKVQDLSAEMLLFAYIE